MFRFTAALLFLLIVVASTLDAANAGNLRTSRSTATRRDTASSISAAAKTKTNTVEANKVEAAVADRPADRHENVVNAVLDSLDEEFEQAKEAQQMHNSGKVIVTPTSSNHDETQTQKHLEPVPPLSELVQEQKVQGDISWMLDFAIIGNPKCGTTFLMVSLASFRLPHYILFLQIDVYILYCISRLCLTLSAFLSIQINVFQQHWLSRSSDTFVHNGEVCSLSRDKPDEVAAMYYDQVTEGGRMAQTSEGHRIKGGLKCPKEISTEKGLDNWSKFFPTTKFIVTTRHPVLWFQSFYNYHAYSQWPKPVPHPNELIGACYENSPYHCTEHCGTERPGNSKICTNRANFHHSLSRLGKTPMNTPEELRLVDHDMSIVPQKGKVFLMEISQLFPETAASKNLPEDISDFLDLKYELHPLKERRGTGTQNHEYKNEDAKLAFVDICEDEYAPVREVLIQQGKDAAEWITNYFMKSEDVVVSSPEEFVKLLDKWGEDPCQKE